MPIYEYICTECNHQIETIQKMSDDALAFCPECSNETLKKKISASAFKLKGTGWYETDFKNTKSNASNEPNAPNALNERGVGDNSAQADGDSVKSDGKTAAGQGKSDAPGKDKASKPSTKQASAA